MYRGIELSERLFNAADLVFPSAGLRLLLVKLGAQLVQHAHLRVQRAGHLVIVLQSQRDAQLF